MVVACEGQLLLLTQPVDGRIPEPGVLSTVPMTEVLHDDEQGQVSQTARRLLFQAINASFESESDSAIVVLKS